MSLPAAVLMTTGTAGVPPALGAAALIAFASAAAPPEAKEAVVEGATELCKDVKSNVAGFFDTIEEGAHDLLESIEFTANDEPLPAVPGYNEGTPPPSATVLDHVPPVIDPQIPGYGEDHPEPVTILITPNDGIEGPSALVTPDQSDEFNGPQVLYAKFNKGSNKCPYGQTLPLDYDPKAKTWTSPAGLVYGKERKYGDRISHVLQHTVPNSKKPMHTEFNIPQENILELIDEARGKLTVPLTEERVGYDIDMGKVVGVGGERKIRLILEKYGKVITAYPIK